MSMMEEDNTRFIYSLY